VHLRQTNLPTIILSARQAYVFNLRCRTASSSLLAFGLLIHSQSSACLEFRFQAAFGVVPDRLKAVFQTYLPHTRLQTDLRRKSVETDLTTLFARQIPLLAKAVVSLPVAAVLGAVLAFRPVRQATPRRDMEVVHTQILLAVIGAMIMLVIGESLARAFGIAGAAGLIRYRARVRDPKDAGVMLATLGIGLASGVGLYLLALFATMFLLVVLLLIESYSPKAPDLYRLKISTSEPTKLRPMIEAILRAHHLFYEQRNLSDAELDYDIQIPNEQSVDTVSVALQKLESAGADSFTWKLKKDDD
jgi:uncharacterized membrane protein YhiD involved in acid resistance